MQINTLLRLPIPALCVLLFFTISCKKEDTPNPTPPVSTDPVQYETPFTGIPATSDVVLYEINERAFSTSGDLAGILPRLDSIKALGVNTIWLMPIHPIGTINSVNSPYSVQDYFKVNPEYGTLEDLRTLVREAHKRGMAVILDWIANHTAWDNPWIENKAWYTQDASGNIIHPAGTNWMDVADLNFENSKMRLEMIRALKFWVLTANVDGYRCDAADYVPFEFWKQAIDSLKNIPNRQLILLAEGARKDHFDAGFQMNFGWDFFTKNKNVYKSGQAATGYLSIHQNEYSAIPAGSQKMRFTSNHDECAWDDTPLGLFGGKKASMGAFVITAYMGGVPLIYNGQEVGCSVKLPFFSRSPIDWSTNPDMFAEYKLLMKIRAEHPALRKGTLESFSTSDIAVFQRNDGTEQVLVLVNTRSSTKSFIVPVGLQGNNWKNARDGTAFTLGSSVDLSGFEYKILVKQ